MHVPGFFLEELTFRYRLNIQAEELCTRLNFFFHQNETFQCLLKRLCTWNPLCPEEYVEITREKKQNQKNTKEKKIESQS